MNPTDQPVIGESPAFLGVLEEVSRAAGLNRPVLIVGERGTGKEVIAERLHFLSPRWDGPLVKLNCAAISESLLESELFGHEAGAFTDASRQRAGRFERADGGTLFLDELANTSLAVQEKILRVIEYGQFERLGSTRPLEVDVRLVGASNVDLPELADRGLFRADLLDRLAFDVITLPPLRERREDILPLAEHFAMRMSRELGRELFAGFSRPVLEAMLVHPWPGNVRELKNVVERAVYRLDEPEAPVGTIEFDPFDSPWRPTRPTDGPEQLPDPAREPIDLRAWLDAQEKRLTEAALAATGGHRGKAAERLGLSYDQLRGILRKHDIGRDSDQES
ncbi:MULTISPECIES: phage shock protein operon transcriptional activator [unclassified Wenzhouxiangella]|uniref:phage shock protein operon transcriptional activator n=1 Tax=unclassified Wenzhouxiangella TaxID=2613841 RepID=UPI000E327876|nr:MULTISPECIES: phage shock protein operon transcriptional activator [unclassified Wenzhouxiangella]RFF28315.1 phage shock protein operon transcriptional activator [Wenzhouxiangella sp. 15181]RFP67760.1 phage shock protein operon transcriptional activator [Wenzhouxiangella sp. 15190]